ncbi:MAG: hypothetical protein QNJ55_11015 [Xenococcus sp. MO_188.B8]|nr:hypothetical protein [Xenococcus sp. MO_188.B8]
MNKKSFLAQIMRIYKIFLIIYFPAFFLLLVVGIISWRTNIPIMNFTRDPLGIMNAPFYIGILSNLGILFWAAGSAICFFSAAIITYINPKSQAFYFLLFGGIITTVLLYDDFFQFHERVFPKYLNTSESQVFIIYFLMILAYLIFFRKKIMATDFLVLGMALLGFTISATIDEVFVNHFRGKFLVEDGFKFLSIISWTTYYTRVGITEIKYHLKTN